MKRIALALVCSIVANLALAQDTTLLSIVTTHEELDLSDVDLVAIPTKGPYMLAGNQLVSLKEGNDIGELTPLDSIIVDDIIWTGNGFVVKSGYEIYSLNNYSEPLMDFDILNYDIFPLDDKRIYIVSHQNDTSLLFLANFKVKRTKRLLTIGEKIVNVSRLGEATMVVTTRNIYMFHDKKCTRFLNLWAPVKTAVMTDKGIVFATDNEICLLSGVNQFMLLFEAQTKKLLYDNQYLYIQLKEGDLLQCNLDAFISDE